MTTVSEEAREGSAAAPAQEPGTTADAGACARASLPLPFPAPPEEVTQRVRALHAVLARAAEFLDRPGSLAHAHPPAFARARELHHARAARHNVPVLRAARLAWGYAHLILIKPALNFAEWVTETPSRFFGAVALALIVYFWS